MKKKRYGKRTARKIIPLVTDEESLKLRALLNLNSDLRLASFNRVNDSALKLSLASVK